MEINRLKNQYLNYIVEYRGLSLGTKTGYGFDLSQFIYYLSSKDINSLKLVTTKIIENYLSELTCSFITKARRRSSIKSFFIYLCRENHVKNNPASNLESMKLPEKNPEYLSSEECLYLLKIVKQKATPYYRARDLMIIQLLLKTGLRRAEIVGLNIEDIDLSKRTIRVTRKGNHQVQINIHQQLITDIESYLKTIKRARKEPFFISKRGSRLSASSIWHLVKTYSRKAGLNEKVTVHSLRHTFATTLLAQGLQLPYIQELMGHKSSQTTSRYLHFQNTELLTAFNNINFDERG